MAKVLVAGCGDIGIALSKPLIEAGHEVWGLRRNTVALPASIRPVQADLGDPQSLQRLPENLDFVFYTATPGSRDLAAYQRTYVEGVANLVAALKQPGPGLKRLFYVSSTSVYGQNAGEWVDESSPTEPASPSGQAVLRGEQLALRSGLAATCVRFGGIYGPGRNRLIQRVEDGAQCVFEPPQYTNRIHRDDCVGVLAHLLAIAANGAPASHYLAVDDYPAPEHEVLEWLALQLRRPGPKRADPTSRVRRAGTKRCSNRQLRTTGYRFRYPTFREGYGPLVAAYVEAKRDADPSGDKA